MKMYYYNCPLCGHNHYERICPAFYKNKMMLFEDICICTRCGLVYKVPVVMEMEQNMYQSTSAWSWGDHDKRLESRADFLIQFCGLQQEDFVLDIGCGPAFLLRRIEQRLGSRNLVGLEPSPNIASEVAKKNRNITILPSNLNDCGFGGRRFKLITAIGVDYLFDFWRNDIKTIESLLEPDGIFYLERNVFVDSEALVGPTMYDLEDMFGSNIMMKTWFSEEQLDHCLGTMFDIIDKTVNDSQTIPPHNCKNRMVGWLCKKRQNQNNSTGIPEYPIEWVNYSKKVLNNIARNSSIRDIKLLSDNGIRNLVVFGVSEESRILGNLITEHNDCSLVCYLVDDSTGGRVPNDDNVMMLSDFLKKNIVYDGVLVPSARQQNAISQYLTNNSISPDKIYPCFRDQNALPFFNTREMVRSDVHIQVKAFLPATLRGLTR